MTQIMVLEELFQHCILPLRKIYDPYKTHCISIDEDKPGKSICVANVQAYDSGMQRFIISLVGIGIAYLLFGQISEGLSIVAFAVTFILVYFTLDRAWALVDKYFLHS